MCAKVVAAQIACSRKSAWNVGRRGRERVLGEFDAVAKIAEWAAAYREAAGRR
jgi:hypothetical protein